MRADAGPGQRRSKIVEAQMLIQSTPSSGDGSNIWTALISQDERLSRVPMKRAGSIDEIVQGVLFLASAESSYVTGTELVIDGGALSI